MIYWIELGLMYCIWLIRNGSTKKFLDCNRQSYCKINIDWYILFNCRSTLKHYTKPFLKIKKTNKRYPKQQTTRHHTHWCVFFLHSACNFILHSACILFDTNRTKRKKGTKLSSKPQTSTIILYYFFVIIIARINVTSCMIEWHSFHLFSCQKKTQTKKNKHRNSSIISQ